MSDRSWVCITLPIKDEAKLLEAMGFSMAERDGLDPEEKDGLLTVTFHEMDYAGNDLLNDMARKRVTFMAQCGPGSNYGETLSLGYSGSFAEVPSMGVEPACPVGRNLEPNARTMTDIRRYWKLRKKVEAEFEKVRKASRKQTALDRHLEKSDMPQ